MLKRVWAASALAVAALILMVFVGCVSAEIIADHEFSNAAPVTYDYRFDYSRANNNDTDNGVRLKYVYCKEITDFALLEQIIFRWDADKFTFAVDGDGNPIYSQYSNSVLSLSYSGAVGNVTHGYSYQPGLDVVEYLIYVHDIDIGASTGNQFLFFDWLPGAWGFNECPYEGGADYELLEDLECLFGYNGNVLGYNTYYDYGDPNMRCLVSTTRQFKNLLWIDDVAGLPGMMTFTIQRQNIPGWSGSVTSKYHIYDADYLYRNQSTKRTVNESFSIWADPACDWLNVTCVDAYGSNFFYQFDDICDVLDPGFFTLSGYTRSVLGNLIPGVLLTAQGDSEYSNNISFYEFENLETGSFTLAGNKTGYYNTSKSLYMGSPGNYQHDVYMIPLDALDEGEFGGVVYDYCTLKSIPGAYVYLFNETADTGKYAYSNKYGFYRFAGMTENLSYKVSASKDGYDGSIVHSFTFNESNVNETHRKTKSIWLLPEEGCPEDGGIPTPPPAPTPPPHEWTNEEIVSWLRVNLMSFFIIVFLFTFLWFIRKAGGAKR